MAGVSDDLIWELVSRHNSKSIKQKGGVRFTREANNLTQKPSRCYSGFANGKALGIVNGENGNSQLTMKTKVHGTKPRKGTRVIAMRTHARGTKRCNATIIKLTKEQYYRDDLTVAALARLTKQAKAARRKEKGVKYVPKSRSNK